MENLAAMKERDARVEREEKRERDFLYRSSRCPRSQTTTPKVRLDTTPKVRLDTTPKVRLDTTPIVRLDM